MHGHSAQKKRNQNIPKVLCNCVSEASLGEDITSLLRHVHTHRSCRRGPTRRGGDKKEDIALHEEEVPWFY